MSKNQYFIALNFYIVYSHSRESENMIYPSIDKLLVEVGSKYLLVNLISKRVKEMKRRYNYQMKESEYVSKRYRQSFRRSFKKI